MVEKVVIHTPWIELEQLLKLAGVASTGGEAKALIRGGGASVNGEPCLARGRKLKAGDRVEAGDRILEVAGG